MAFIIFGFHKNRKNTFLRVLSLKLESGTSKPRLNMFTAFRPSHWTTYFWHTCYHNCGSRLLVTKIFFEDIFAKIGAFFFKIFFREYSLVGPNSAEIKWVIPHLKLKKCIEKSRKGLFCEDWVGKTKSFRTPTPVFHTAHIKIVVVMYVKKFKLLIQNYVLL